MAQDERSPIKLVWDIPDDMVTVLAPHAAIAARDGYFVVTFGQPIDPIVLSQEDADQLEALGYIPLKPVVRIAVPRPAMGAIFRAFYEHLSTHAPDLLPEGVPPKTGTQT